MSQPLEKIDLFRRKTIAIKRAIAMAAAMSIFFLIACALNLYNSFAHIQESTSFLALLVSGICLTSATLIWIFKKRKSRNRIIKRIESTYPELKDALITADELLNDPEHLTNPFSSHIIQSADSFLETRNWQKEITTITERFSSFLLLAGVMFLLLFAASNGPVFAKAINFGKDLLKGESSGIEVTSLPLEVARGGDFHLTSVIHRWEQDAYIQLTDAVSGMQDKMFFDETGKARYRFFNVGEPITFKIKTPSLVSKSYELSIYDPPRIDSINIEVIPPEYTGLKEYSESGIVDVSVIEGSRIALKLTTNGTDAAIILGAKAFEFERKEANNFSINLTPESSSTYSLEVTDSDMRKMRSSEAQLTIVPDEPPVVEILEPEKDTFLEPGDDLSMRIFASDDFGLSKGALHISMSGEKLPPIDLGLERNELGAYERIVELYTLLPLSQYNPRDGDVVSIYVQVSDNKFPTPNSSRTDLLFIEIRENKPPTEMEGMPMDVETLDLRVLISEQKRLIRESHSISQEAYDKITPEELSADIGTLKQEIQKTYLSIEDKLMEAGAEELAFMFQDAVALNGKALEEVSSKEIDSAQKSMGTALSLLVRLENFFRQNTISKEPNDGEGGQGESQGSSESDSEEPDNSPVEQTIAALDELSELIRQQNKLNQAYRDQETSSPTKGLADKQKDLSDILGSLSRKVQKNPIPNNAAQLMDQAQKSMNRAAKDISNGSSGSAMRNGQRASDALKSAERTLKEVLEETYLKAMEAAEQEVRNLAKAQAEAQGKTQSSREEDNEVSQALEQEQRSLNSEFEQLSQFMEEIMSRASLSDQAVSEALQAATQRANEMGIQRSMERAANALLYEQLGAAQRMQSKAAQSMESLADQLGESRKSIQNSPERKARSLLNQSLGMVQKLESGEVDIQEASSMRNRLQENNEIISDLTERSLSRRMEELLNSSDTMGLMDQTALFQSILAQNIRQLLDYLDTNQTENAIRINKDTATPPDQYRKQVESYFKQLARERD